MEHWRALELWKDPKYLIKKAGIRTVPIEIGSRYTEEDWSQRLITFSDFIQSHVTKHNDEVGYLAQHQLFDQVDNFFFFFEISISLCFRFFIACLLPQNPGNFLLSFKMS